VLELGETFSSGTFLVKDATGALGAATVTCSVTLPDMTTTAPTVTTPSLGAYVFDYIGTLPGRYAYVMTATGGVLGSIVRKQSGMFVVDANTNLGVVSLEEAKSHLNIPLTTTRADAEIEGMIAAATDKIEQKCGPVLRRTVIERVTHNGGRAVWLREPPGPGGNPYITVTSVAGVTSGLTITPTDLDVDPVGRVTYVAGTRFGSGDYIWTYQSGRTSVPPGLRQAALNYVKGSYETQRPAAGLPWIGAQDVAVESPGMGLVLWRMELDMKPFLLPPGQA
jgi:hypothetical protein